MGEERLELRYVPLSRLQLLGGNAKLHDLDLIIESIKLHGFKDPAKWEPALNGGAGGIVEGNGRTEALSIMVEGKFPAPRGIVVDADSEEWLVPVLFGVDAPDEQKAIAYAIDHNNLTVSPMANGVDAIDMYDPGAYMKLASIASAATVSISSEDVHALESLLSVDKSGGEVGPVEEDDPGSDEYDESDYWPVIKIKVPQNVFTLYEEVLGKQDGDEDWERFENLLKV